METPQNPSEAGPTNPAAAAQPPSSTPAKPATTESTQIPSSAISESVENAPGAKKLPPPSRMNDEQKSCRLFLGNLDTEATSKDEVRKIFEKYGSIRDVNLHRGFGFVQFEEHDSLEKAILNEQGRQVGSKNLDLEAAKKKGGERGGGGGGDRVKRGGGMAGGMSGRGRGQAGRGGGRGGRRGRSSDRRFDRGPPGAYRSRSRSYDRGYGGHRGGRGGGHRPRRGRSYSPPGHAGRGRSRGRDGPRVADIPPPKDQIVVKLILLGEQQREFAEQVVDALKPTGIPFQLGMLDGRGLGDALRDCEHTMNRYACIIGRENAKHRKVTTKLLFEKYFGKQPRTLELGINEIAEAVVNFERDMGFMPNAPHRSGAPPPVPNQFGQPGPPVPPHAGYQGGQPGPMQTNMGYPPGVPPPSSLQSNLPNMPPQVLGYGNPSMYNNNNVPGMPGMPPGQPAQGNLQVQLTPQQLQLLQSLNQLPGNQQQQSAPPQQQGPSNGQQQQAPGNSGMYPQTQSAIGYNNAQVPSQNNQGQQPMLSAEQMNDLSTLLSSINSSATQQPPNASAVPPQQQQQQYQQQQYPQSSGGNPNSNNVRRY